MATMANALLQRRKEPDEEQLLKLFWNRAELKKELAQLRRDKDKLIDQLRQQEGINLRSQQKLEQLENLLADPLQAMNALVYYQLRGVWQQGRRRLARVARELEERQRDREEQHARARFDQMRDADLAALDTKLGELNERARVVANDLQAFEDHGRSLRGFWNFFRRRAAAECAEATRATIEGLQSQIERLHTARRSKEAEPVPSLGRTIESVVRRLEALERLNALVRRRAEFLKLTAQYRRETDTVPVAGSFATVPVLITEAGEPRPADDRVIPVNVLADEYWDIYAVLLN
jgi:chromosome segregation ATPase